MALTSGQRLASKSAFSPGLKTAKIRTSSSTYISKSTISRIADSVSDRVRLNQEEFAAKDQLEAFGKDAVDTRQKGGSGMEGFIKDSVMRGNLNTSASNRNGNASAGGGNIFGFSQGTKDALTSTGEDVGSIGALLGVGIGLYGLSSYAAVAAATAGTGGTALLVGGGVVLASQGLGEVLKMLGKYGEWHPDQYTNTGTAGFDPVTGKFDDGAVKVPPRNIYGGEIFGGSSGVPITRQEVHLAEIAIAEGTGGHITNPNPFSTANGSGVNTLNNRAVDFHFSGGGLTNPSLHSFINMDTNNSFLTNIDSLG